jgi:ELWxxDGT repeat protein
MSSARHANFNRAVVLSLLMVMMTQVGYLESMNPWTSGEETLDETNDVLETGGSGSSQSNFTSSIEGADLIIDEPMTNITFQYNTNAASGSGSGSGSCSGSGSGSVSSDGTYNGNGTKWMVKDINTVVGNSNSPYSSNPSKFVVVGNTLYFSAYDGIHGEELWKTDGTAACTVMVKDINSGYGSSNPGITEEAVIGNTLYFGADDGTNGYELWKTDGTASGTVMVKNINSGSGNSGNSGPAYFTVIGNTLYFRAGDASGYELWKSDGTTSGTVMVKDINSGGSSSPNSLTAIGNTLYFQADDGTHGRELWKSDGTASGTVMVKDIYASPHGVAHSSPSELTSFGNALYFRAYDPTNGTELWKSDGTTSGTVCLKDIISGSSGGGASQFTVVGDTLFFLAYTVANRYTIWKTNGTTSGTVMVKDTCSGCSSVYDTAPHHFTAVGDTLFFVGARSQYQRVGVWVSDGTTSGTTMLKSFTSSSNYNQIVGFTPHGDTAYFKHLSSSGTIYSMWQSDGTASGTVNARLSAFTGTTIAPMGTTVYVSHHDNQYKTELWALDPAAITGLSTGIANVTGATCTVSPSLPTGLSIDSSTCTISGTPTALTSNTTYTVTANISNVTYQTTVWLSSAYLELTPSVEGADLITDEAMTNITFQYNASAASGSGSGRAALRAPLPLPMPTIRCQLEHSTPAPSSTTAI